MWRMEPGAKPVLYGEADGWKTLKIWGMGIASHDLNFDGYPEYFLTSMADNKLQTLAVVPETGAPKPTYADVAFARGAIAQRPYMGDDLRPSTAWHAQFEDVNNDGLADLFVAKGNVAKMPDFAEKDPNNLLLQRPDGTFLESGGLSGVGSTRIARGAALVDFNLDGLLDLVVVNRWEPAELWRNTTADAGNWLQLRLRQPGPNPDAIGSWIEVRLGDVVQRREVTSGGGHAGGSLGWWHMGIGAEKAPEIRVIWPDGSAGAWQRVEANAFYDVGRDGTARPWLPPR
jgi:hypothetical protein